ncbi:hypothetical protein EIK76_01170 [Rheinheimera mesophila]|uniref:Uncharacterized protein n=1 Tax=Rheinheimera mesophila TaxID=1547515 RepID=A0A0M2T2X2_9GAMM|nr:hypothetical protein [Rheinheimera mesophila]KKL00995.1 hypothetical protein SD53_12205 [Rheinheimera mesophila]KKL01013.1 hypothetical protein SD53_12080 [Rheinheimera mesophila]RRJ22726.1 hypothetical protein EIK76_01170 [Rheinheimera mesophila]
MPKIQAFATATGDRNSYILMEVGENVPIGYTEKMPPLAAEGYTVAWDEQAQDWHQVAIPQPETEQE